MIDKNELRKLAQDAGGIEWYASTAYCSKADRESMAIYHRPTEFHCVEIVETPDSDKKNNDCIHDKAYWLFIGAANPSAILSLLDELEAKSAAECKCWRSHSVNYAKGEKCPQTIETLQAAWDRDQELLLEQRAEIAKLKEKLNSARNKLAARGFSDG